MMRKFSTVTYLLLIGLNACNAPDTVVKSNSEPVYIANESLRESGFPLSSAVETDGLIFLSGMLGTVAGQGFVERGIETETRQTMENIKSLLAEQGLAMGDIVKCTVMLADMSEWPAFNAVYKTYFDGQYPARSAFAVSGLAGNARVEVECIARR